LVADGDASSVAVGGGSAVVEVGAGVGSGRDEEMSSPTSVFDPAIRSRYSSHGARCPGGHDARPLRRMVILCDVLLLQSPYSVTGM